MDVENVKGSVRFNKTVEKKFSVEKRNNNSKDGKIFHLFLERNGKMSKSIEKESEKKTAQPKNEYYFLWWIKFFGALNRLIPVCIFKFGTL